MGFRFVQCQGLVLGLLIFFAPSNLQAAAREEDIDQQQINHREKMEDLYKRARKKQREAQQLTLEKGKNIAGRSKLAALRAEGQVPADDSSSGVVSFMRKSLTQARQAVANVLTRTNTDEEIKDDQDDTQLTVMLTKLPPELFMGAIREFVGYAHERKIFDEGVDSLISKTIHSDSFDRGALSRNERFVVLGGVTDLDSCIVVMATYAGAVATRHPIGFPPNRLAISSDGAIVAAVTDAYRTIRVWTRGKDAELRSLTVKEMHTGSISSIELGSTNEGVPLLHAEVDRNGNYTSYEWELNKPEEKAVNALRHNAKKISGRIVGKPVVVTSGQGQSVMVTKPEEQRGYRFDFPNASEILLSRTDRFLVTIDKDNKRLARIWFPSEQRRHAEMLTEAWGLITAAMDIVAFPRPSIDAMLKTIDLWEGSSCESERATYREKIKELFNEGMQQAQYGEDMSWQQNLGI
ncbi:MAG TPA: hypothetical protein VGT41_00335 [Candidatus Babeliales bacterium]|nr:hypothetical protein [Candidatus Babeliales bacterium]